MHGAEVCFFAMYVQEYGSDCPEPNTNRVYISYLDSVRYFESSPEGHRTTVYHSMLISYLQYAKDAGYTHAHIWVAPPKQGDDYIFYAHPDEMVSKRMGLLKLKEWYEKMLVQAKARNIVVDFQDMHEHNNNIESIDDIPIFSGDHWAASIVNKMNAQAEKEEKKDEQKNKEKVKQQQQLDEEGRAPKVNHRGEIGAGSSYRSGGTNGGGISAQELAHAAALSGDRALAESSSSHAASSKAGESNHDQLLSQINDEMRSMKNHFVVVTLIEMKKGTPHATIVDPVPLMTNEFVDTRSAFLEKCQMYHWQFDELRNAQHSTLMLLYYLHGMHKVAKAKMAELNAAANSTSGTRSGVPPPAVQTTAAPDARSRSCKIQMAMMDWSALLAHANDAAASETWALPPDELFQRILAQINRSKRDILQEKYNACLEPSCPAPTRSVFIRVLKRIAESFMSCLLQMQSGRDGGAGGLSQG